MRNQVQERFSEFYENWFWKLEVILHELLEASKQKHEVLNEEELKALVSKVTTHVKEFYNVKWSLAHEDILVFFSPVWVSPLENAYMWMTGWKPSTLFRLIESFKKTLVESSSRAFNISEELQKKVEQMKIRNKFEEEKVEREMERIQVALADQKMFHLARLTCQAARNGGGSAVPHLDGMVEGALNGLFGGLEKVMKSADCVRLKALKGVLDVLTPIQSVEFLAAFIGGQVRLRQCGKKMEKAEASKNQNVDKSN